ncbi:MAG: prepilin-type N-terminal cleavage/methylation domain-containing protein [Desulfobacterales bacterium]|jgi:prepilin-type N-terminal cleavage/methylation domain-containing protein
MAAKQVLFNLKGMNNQGLTIIEIMFALSIFAIGILAVSALTITSVNANASSRMLTEATTLAEDRLERLMTLPYDTIIEGSTTEGPYEVSWTVLENEIAEKTKSITVTVIRPGGLKETKVAIRHLISKSG